MKNILILLSLTVLLCHTASASLVFFVGVDNGNNSEVNHEASSDDHYYFEDGDYTALGGVNWTGGQEPLHDAVLPGTPASAPDGGDNTIGFDRALTSGDFLDNIYFQLTAAEIASGNTFTFTSDHVQENGLHDINYSMNGNLFHSVTGIGTGTAIDTFTPVEVGAVVGSNFIRIERIDVPGTGWIQYDFVSLEVIPEPSTLGLVLVGAAGMLAARRRR